MNPSFWWLQVGEFHQSCTSVWTYEGLGSGTHCMDCYSKTTNNWGNPSSTFLDLHFTTTTYLHYNYISLQLHYTTTTLHYNYISLQLHYTTPNNTWIQSPDGCRLVNSIKAVRAYELTKVLEVAHTAWNWCSETTKNWGNPSSTFPNGELFWNIACLFRISIVKSLHCVVLWKQMFQ